MHKLTEKVLKYCKDNELIQKGETIICALSGGKDSVCLFSVLLELKEKLDFCLVAVHVEHGIRGEESRADAEFVKDLCKKNNTELKVYNEDVPVIAKKDGLSLEEAARYIRYKDFERAIEELGADKVAVAHHMNDQAETVLFNMIRGSSIKGLTGMRGRRDRIIRPLLNVTRAEIEEYVSDNSLLYVTDMTNEDTAYSRNRIRHMIIPEMEKLGERAVEHIAREAGEMSEILDYIEDKACKLYKSAVRDEKDIPEKTALCIADIKEMQKEAEVICRYMIKIILTRICDKWKDISYQNIDDIIKLLRLQSGKEVCLPYEVRVKRVNDSLYFYRGRDRSLNNTVTDEELDPIGRTELSDGEIIECRVFAYSPEMSYPQNDYTKWFDYDKISAGPKLRVRNRHEGDTIDLGGGHGNQSISRFFINQKIPSDERDNIKLLARGSDIIWIIGLRMGGSCKISEATKRVLEVRVIR
ncbi:MAG: tRNA lysidine(34) synthetase TilS [Lachnospiraceae bacterium]|nr:tRNA lysidine(34) synthetase TilS [Lachnospiraceae bacterium]